MPVADSPHMAQLILKSHIDNSESLGSPNHYHDDLHTSLTCNRHAQQLPHTGKCQQMAISGNFLGRMGATWSAIPAVDCGLKRPSSCKALLSGRKKGCVNTHRNCLTGREINELWDGAFLIQGYVTGCKDHLTRKKFPYTNYSSLQSIYYLYFLNSSHRSSYLIWLIISWIFVFDQPGHQESKPTSECRSLTELYNSWNTL